MKSLLLDEHIKSYVFLMKWILLAISAGLVGSSVVHVFIIALRFMVAQVTQFDIPIFMIPLFGALISGGIIYRINRDSSGEGMPSYIQGMRYHKGALPVGATCGKFLAALLTLGTLGSGGIVGPLGRVSAGIMSFGLGLIKKKMLDEKTPDVSVAAICGMAAVVGAVFHSSIGAGFFAVEVIRRSNMGYRDLFPAILSSTTAVYASKAFGWDRFYYLPSTNEFMAMDMIGVLLLLALATGLCGSLYTSSYQKIALLFGRQKGNIMLKVLIGSFISGLLVWWINPELMSTSNGLVKAVIEGDMSVLSGNVPLAWSPAIILMIMVLFKGLTNCITVGSGMSAGFTGPAALMGMMIGAAFAYMFGVETGSPTYYAFIAAGFSGMLSSSMNVPLAAAIMAPELFGIVYSLPAAVAAIIGFQLTRHKTIYDDAIADELARLLDNDTE